MYKGVDVGTTQLVHKSRPPSPKKHFLIHCVDAVVKIKWLSLKCWESISVERAVLSLLVRLTWRKQGRWLRVIHSGTSRTMMMRRRRKTTTLTPNLTSLRTMRCLTTTELRVNDTGLLVDGGWGLCHMLRLWRAGMVVRTCNTSVSVKLQVWIPATVPTWQPRASCSHGFV